MSTLVVRLYHNAQDAHHAAEDLKRAGYHDVAEISASGQARSAASADTRHRLVSEMMKAHIWREHADAYADRLVGGEALVAAYAPFGTSYKVGTIMDRHAPSATGYATERHEPAFEWDDHAPFSSGLRLAPLTNVKLPMELLTGVSSLTKGSGFLSHWFGIPLLSHGVAHKENSMGFPMLSDSPTPLSSAIGMATLSRNPTPLSSMFGMRLLERDDL